MPTLEFRLQPPKIIDHCTVLRILIQLFDSYKPKYRRQTKFNEIFKDCIGAAVLHFLHHLCDFGKNNYITSANRL